MRACASASARACVRTVRACGRAYVSVHARVRTHVYQCVRAYVSTYVRACVCVYQYVCVRALVLIIDEIDCNRLTTLLHWFASLQCRTKTSCMRYHTWHFACRSGHVL